MTEPRLRLRVDFGGGKLGPGKVSLLEAIAREGSISGGARAMKMSYRRAWELVEALNNTFGQPVLNTAAGGRKGGGARLTPLGQEVIARFRAAEELASRAAGAELQALARHLPAPR